VKYIAIGVDGHQHGLGECEDFIIAAQIVRDFIDDEVVAIHVVMDDVIQG